MSGFLPSTTVLVGTAEPLLIAVIGLLALVILGLAALALLLRRRNRAQAAVALPPPRPPASLPVAPVISRPRPRLAQHVRSGGSSLGASGGLAVATASAMVCPTCRTEYHGMTYCTHDARRLVPPEEMLGGPGLGPMRALSRSAGLVCMACRRAYEPGLRSCPHDGNELVPFPVYNATRPRRAARTTEPAGVIARICPVCGSKYDLNARFCGHDAGQLVVIN
jgi:RNA polymerase subunit RPABC4/transcription elongation factor Spt4